MPIGEMGPFSASAVSAEAHPSARLQVPRSAWTPEQEEFHGYSDALQKPMCALVTKPQSVSETPTPLLQIPGNVGKQGCQE